MTYDPVDTNDDGVVDADVDNESVKTGDLDVNGVSGVKNPNDVGLSRSLGTWEQNTTGNPLVVLINRSIGTGNVSDSDVFGYNIHLNDSQTDQVVLTAREQESDGFNGIHVSQSFIVPGEAYYKLEISDNSTGDAGGISSGNWFEQEMGL